MGWENLSKSESLIADEIWSNLKSGQYTPTQLVDYIQKAMKSEDFNWARAATVVYKSIPDYMKATLGATGAATTKLIGPVGAAVGGWSLGRILGQTPLLTDQNMTYDQFYQNMFQNLLRAKQIRKNSPQQVTQGAQQ